MSIVRILITGVGMGYKKSLPKGGEVWTLLFPFNECHSLKFRVSRDGVGPPYDFVAHLAQPGAEVAVSTNLALISPQSDSDFDKYVLDLTSPAAWGTHVKLRRVSNWENRGVRMTIENAKFHVQDYVADINNLDPCLKGPSTERRITTLAHRVYAQIDLGSTGVLKINAKDGSVLFESVPGKNALLWFDNDCKDREPISNDMDLLYYLVEDADGSGRQFQVIGKAPVPGSSPSESVQFAFRRSKDAFPDTGDTPDLGVGKPCMFVTVGDPENLP